MRIPPAFLRLSAAGLLAVALVAPFALAGPTCYFDESASINASGPNAFADWWDGSTMLAIPGRDRLAERGIALGGDWSGAFYGVLQSENGQKGFFDQQIQFAADIDFARLLGVAPLEGLSAFAKARFRQPSSGETPGPNEAVEAQGLFNPSHFQSGTQWRFLQFGLAYSTASIFGTADFLSVKAGWIQPQQEFALQPLSKLFVNAAIFTTKGIGGNIPFSSGFSTWGSTFQVKPTPHTYIRNGLFLAYAESTASSNHALAFEGFAQDRDRNSVLYFGEAGFTPEFGPDRLPGKYAAGGYYYGLENTSFFGQTHDAQYGFYWQADQMLFRESSSDPVEPVYAESAGDAKSFDELVALETPAFTDQGLYTFNILTFAPSYNNRYPFYFHSGLVYKGLLPIRDRDQLVGAIALGQHSFDRIESLQDAGNPNQSNLTALVEGGYRVQINGWAYTQPFVQYVIKPDGTANVEKAWILGVISGVNF